MLEPVYTEQLPETIEMNGPDGTKIPVPIIGFGTWAAGNTDWCYQATLKALQAGYRHIDCAWKYGVDEPVGRAIRDSGIPRSEIFVTTKFWPQFAAPENVEKCLDLVLKNMGLDYIDLYLAHWPVAVKAAENIAEARAYDGAPNDVQGIVEGQEVKNESGDAIDLEHSCSNIAAQFGKDGSFAPTWLAMREPTKTSKCRAVGVSNFSIPQLQEILPHATDVPISCNQIEAHPWLPNDELLEFMKRHQILGTVYSPFAGQKQGGEQLVQNAVVKKVAKNNDMDVGQALQSWAVMRGTIPLGKSQNEGRIKSNLAVKALPRQDFEDLSALKLKGDEGRTVDFSGYWGVKFFV